MEVGVRVVNRQFYLDEIYSRRNEVGTKPWFISIIYSAPRKDNDHSLYMYKSLYFLARDKSNEVNVGIIYMEDELTKEAFEFRSVP
jgi:hypothetical protein